MIRSSPVSAPPALSPAWLALTGSAIAALGPCVAPPRARADEVPAPLRCLERYYGVLPERAPGESARYYAVLPDGQRLLYDDGRPKTPDERLDDPDLQDMFAQRYPQGPITPVTTPDEDPGRTRVDALFRARYGSGPNAVPVVPFVLFGTKLRVHRLVEPAFARARTRLEALVHEQPALRVYFKNLGGTFVVRNIAGTTRRSAHSYGVSLDINVERSHYWRWQRPPAPLRWRNEIPPVIVQAFEAEGFIWGGRWYHYDTMHFEYRPELLDPSCSP